MDDPSMEFLLDAVDRLETSDLQSFSAIFSVFSLTRHGRRRCCWIIRSPLHEEFADSHDQPDPVMVFNFSLKKISTNQIQRDSVISVCISAKGPKYSLEFN
jgi:hypothetical protein